MAANNIYTRGRLLLDHNVFKNYEIVGLKILGLFWVKQREKRLGEFGPKVCNKLKEIFESRI